MESMHTDLKRFNCLTAEIDAVYHDAALRLGLSDSALMILYTVCTYGESCLLHDITRLSGVSKQTIHSALHKLADEGIVYLEPVSGRKKRVCLTETGKAFAEQTVLQVIEIENEIFDGWTEAEREMYIGLTQRYLSAFREKVKELPR